MKKIIAIFLFICSLPMAMGQADYSLLLQLNTTVTASGPNTWYDISTTAIDYIGEDDSHHYVDDQVTVAQAGTATKIRVYTFVSSGVNIKVALYDLSNNLLASGTGSVVSAGYTEVNFTSSVGISAGNYRIGYALDDTGSTGRYETIASGGNYQVHSLEYASFPESPRTAGTSRPTYKLVIGLFVL